MARRDRIHAVTCHSPLADPMNRVTTNTEVARGCRHSVLRNQSVCFRLSPGFISQQDQGYLLVVIQLPDSASLARTEEVAVQGLQPAPAK